MSILIIQPSPYKQGFAEPMFALLPQTKQQTRKRPSPRLYISEQLSSRNTIKEVLNAANRTGINWPLDDSVTNEVLMATFYPERLTATNPRKEPDYSYIHKELAKPGVNLTLLWSEYCEKCHNTGNTPYMYTQFCDKYRRWARVTKAT